MSTDTRTAGFEPGLVLRARPGTKEPAVGDLWPPLDRPSGHGSGDEGSGTDCGDRAAEPPSLLFDEDEVARLCAAAAAGARSRALAEEARRLREQVTGLGREMREALAALRERQALVLRESRRRAGRILAEAFVRLAPQVLQDTQKLQLARELSAMLPLFEGAGTLRVAVAAGVADALAAALHPLAGDGLDVEVVEDSAAGPGSFRIECGETRIECDPAELVERIAEALRRALTAAQDAEMRSPGGPSETRDHGFEEQCDGE